MWNSVMWKIVVSIFMVCVVVVFSGDVLAEEEGGSNRPDESWVERGYVPEDLPLYPTPKREWEDETGPVTEPLVRRVRQVGSRFKDGVREEPVGFLTGKSVYLSPGHGWTWTGSYWTTQRGNSYGIVEDFSNAEAVNWFLVDYLLRAGAHVVPVREIDTTQEMVICDNEHGDLYPEVCIFEEEGDGALFIDSTLTGYGPQALPLSGQTNPFAQGGNRLLYTDSSATARFLWTFNVPTNDWYNVYVSFSAYEARAPDAHYVVNHALGETHYRVNQRHKGGTWVFLGRFYFVEGVDSSMGSVSLFNDSAISGGEANVSADAVRLGGGVGVVDRGQGASGRPRYEENCRYNAQFSGAPSSVYNSSTSGDHTDDISCRSRFSSWLHEDGEDAVYFSWHSNAGGGTGTSIYIYWPNSHGYCDGSQATPGSRELADLVLAEVVGDIRAVWDPDWTDRGRRCAWFGEINPSFNNSMPAALLELAFHDLPADVEDLKEPAFRRLAARAVYQGIAKYFAQRDGVAPELLPEPPKNVAVRNIEACSVEISWTSPEPDPAGGDPPETYLVYVGGDGLEPGEPFDSNGELSLVLNDLTPGHVYTFKVTALNSGGESLPSRVLAAGVGGWPSSVPILAVQGFGRLDSSQLLSRYESSALGDVDRMLISRMNDGSYMLRHAPEMGTYGVVFDSCEDTALASGALDLETYEMVNLIVGRGADTGVAIDPSVMQELRLFVEGGGNLLVSGSHLVRELSEGALDGSAFLTEVLGAELGGGTATYSLDVQGLTGGPFQLEAGDSRTPFYDVSPTDTITPLEDADIVAEFSPDSSGVAGIEYSKEGSGKVFTFSFPLEGIASPEGRVALMTYVLETFGVQPDESDICEEVVVPDAGVEESDGGISADGGEDYECIDCPCDSNSCSCRTVGLNKSGPGASIYLLVLMVFAGLIRRRLSP